MFFQMIFNLFSKSAKAFSAVVNIKKLRNQPRNRLDKFTSPFKKTEINLKKIRKQTKSLRRKVGVVTSGLVSRLPLLAKKNNNTQLNALCTAMAGQGTHLKLPGRFAGDLGADFIRLIRKALQYKNRNVTSPFLKVNRITGLEVWDFICANKSIVNHAAAAFAHYAEDEVRLLSLSKDWLEIQIPEKSIAKMLSTYAGPNSAEHMEYLKILGLTAKNAYLWLEQILEDHIFLNILDFEVRPNQNLRITYLVPIPIQASKKTSSWSIFNRGKQKMIASDPQNFFKSDFLCFKIVIEYQYETKRMIFDEKSGKLITGFLHNLPLNNEAKATLLKPSSNIFWPFTQSGIQQYISTLGTTGLPVLKSSPIFTILNKGVSPSARR